LQARLRKHRQLSSGYSHEQVGISTSVPFPKHHHTPSAAPTLLTLPRGVAGVCNASNQPLPLQQGLLAQSSCAGGTAFLCDSYQPIPVSEELSYGFAIQVGGSPTADNANCCRCYEAQWLTGAASGKKMVVQIINIANTPGADSDVQLDDLIILTPGGGVGPYNTGCQLQYGARYAGAWYVIFLK